MEERVITHYFRRSPESGGWIPVVAVMRLRSKMRSPYFFGWESRPLTAAQIQERVDNGLLVKLSTPEVTTRLRCLWIADNGDIWLASENDPMGDSERRKVS